MIQPKQSSSTNTVKPNKPSNTLIKLEDQQKFEKELAWCIEQLELGLKNKGVTKEQGLKILIPG